MRDWEEYVREKLSLADFPPERESHIVRELAGQLEDFFQEAMARGSSEADARVFACGQVQDWEALARDLTLADSLRAHPRTERWSRRIEERLRGAPAGGAMLADVVADVRYAVRGLWKNPAFALISMLTLALGIGATTAIFSVIEGVLLRPLPYLEPERLVRVHENVPQYGRFAVAPANFLDWRRQNQAFERIAAFSADSSTLAERGGAERVASAGVSFDLFELLGVSPLLGRGFTAEEDTPGRNGVAVLSHGAFMRRFGGASTVLGRELLLDGATVTVVGVMPPGFYFPSREIELWTPLALDPESSPRGAHYLGVIARMKSDVSLAAARAEMKTIAERLADQFPVNADESAEVTLLHDHVVGGSRASLLTLLVAVGLLTLISCSNTANLLLGRANARGREIALRAALGAGRVRLARQMLAEGVLLALAGGALGLFAAYAALGPLRRLSAGTIPRVDDVSINGAVLAFTLGLSLLTGVGFALLPAWRSSRPRLTNVLRGGGSGSISSGSRKAANALVTAEVALSLVLLVGASLSLRSFHRLASVHPGFESKNVLAFSASLPPQRYPQSSDRIRFYDSLLERLRSLPRVKSVGMTQSLPIQDDYFLSFAIEGRPAPAPGAEPSANYRVVSSGYFRTLEIPLKGGRVFDERDSLRPSFVAIVDEAFVRRHFPEEEPLGRGVAIGNGTEGVYEIVGVVGDVRHDGLDMSPHPTIYVPYALDPFGTMSIVVRTQSDPLELSADVRDAVREIDRGLPAYAIQALGDVVSGSMGERRFSMLLLALFAGIALFLAAVGLYGVVSESVSRRTREMGLRLAVGASRRSLLRTMMGQAMRPALVGIAIGLAAALVLARFLESMLFEVTPFDSASYAATSLLLLLVAALACFVPAHRATRVDPLIALRQD